jgi:alanyl-tRNA synthetase
MQVDARRRDLTRANHSATHLLHAALRRVLGPHVTQKGSFVGPDRLRFDFSHPKALTGEERVAIEADVNAVIRQNTDVSTRLMTPDEAVANGAMALFGEKYGDEVRVLTMGQLDGKPYSIELCGGTHVRRTGDIALFKIVEESAVAAGVRRIEGLTGEAARLYMEEQMALARAAAAALKVAPADLPERVAALVEERKRLEREVADLRRKAALGGGGGRSSEASAVREVGGIKYLPKILVGMPAKDLRNVIDEAKKEIGSGVVAFVAVNDGKAAIAVGVTDDLTKRLSAVELVRKGAEALGGKGGGGRPDLAQAGGPDGARASEALEAISALLSETAVAAE